MKCAKGVIYKENAGLAFPSVHYIYLYANNNKWVAVDERVARPHGTAKILLQSRFD